MEEEKQELECLKEVIKNFEKVLESCNDCDTVTKAEYKKIGDYIDELENRKIELEIEIDGCILEEV